MPQTKPVTPHPHETQNVMHVRIADWTQFVVTNKGDEKQCIMVEWESHASFVHIFLSLFCDNKQKSSFHLIMCQSCYWVCTEQCMGGFRGCGGLVTSDARSDLGFKPAFFVVLMQPIWVNILLSWLIIRLL